MERLARLVQRAIRKKGARGAANIYEDLPWDAMAEKMPGRSALDLRKKWMDELRPVYARKELGPTEDKELLCLLQQSGAVHHSDIVWDRLHPRLSGVVARRRVEELSMHLGVNASLPLHERATMLLPLIKTADIRATAALKCEDLLYQQLEQLQGLQQAAEAIGSALTTLQDGILARKHTCEFSPQAHM